MDISENLYKYRNYVLCLACNDDYAQIRLQRCLGNACLNVPMFNVHTCIVGDTQQWVNIIFCCYYYNVYLTLLFRERTYYLMSTEKRQHDAVNIINLRYTIVFYISNFIFSRLQINTKTSFKLLIIYFLSYNENFIN